jgi:hypothetical protein
MGDEVAHGFLDRHARGVIAERAQMIPNGRHGH